MPAGGCAWQACTWRLAARMRLLGPLHCPVRPDIGWAALAAQVKEYMERRIAGMPPEVRPVTLLALCL
jgi:hypothetical protein